MNSYRTGRVGNVIQEKLGELIVGDKIKDPRVDSFLSITRVEVSRDLTFADVFVSSHKSEAGLTKGVAGLQKAAGFIQAQLAKTMHIRSTPRLRFHADLGIRSGFDMVQRLEALVPNSSDAPDAQIDSVDEESSSH